MNQKQFAHSWDQLKRYVTKEAMLLIDKNLETSNAVVEKHYGAMKDDVSNWGASARYEGYQ